MKKIFLMTLIALSISGMSCAQSDTENTAKKQERLSGKVLGMFFCFIVFCIFAL